MENYKRMIIFGPPFTGKSSLLAYLGTLNEGETNGL